MNMSDEGRPAIDDYVCRLDLQPGSVSLTLSEGTKAEAKTFARP